MDGLEGTEDVESRAGEVMQDEAEGRRQAYQRICREDGVRQTRERQRLAYRDPR